MKKLIFPLLLAALLVLILSGCALSVNADTPYFEQANGSVEPIDNVQPSSPQASAELQPSMASGVDSGLTRLSNITNFVIFICFSDEEIFTPSNSLINMFIGTNNSLRDYYQELSYGSLTIDTVFPKNTDNSYFVYKDTKSRNYYKDISTGSRNSAESALLNAAVNASSGKFNYSNTELDGNGDNYVDMVSFVISGYKVSSWGGLLWPHSWSLDHIISGSAKYSSAKLNDVCVNEFSFTFAEGNSTSYICHETGHVLGMPDLYHYNHSTDKYPAGYWDLMHLNQDCAAPQFTTTYMRDKYLSFVAPQQIKTLVTGGEYTLKPTTIANQNDTLAYVVQISSTESIWIEYRNNKVSTYDSLLSGSGLIVYRINNTVTGNENGRHQSTNYPDELYIYRPNINGVELTNIQAAYVSSDNTHFNSIGVSNANPKYNQSAIYLTNGDNTGIIITPVAQTDNLFTFNIDLAGHDLSEVTEIVVYNQPYEMYYGEVPQPNVKIKYQKNGVYVAPLPDRLTFTYDKELIGTQTATVTYVDDNNNKSTSFTLIIKDKIDIDGISVLTYPYNTEYDIGGSIDLSGLVLKIIKLSGAEEQKAYNEFNRHDWLIEGVDNTKSGTYVAEVTYKPMGVTVKITIKILSSLAGIKILKTDTVTVIKQGENPVLNVVGVNTDDSYRKLERYEYRISTFEANNYWTAQTLTVTYINNENFFDTTYLYMVQGTLNRINVTKPTKTEYSYGAKLNLEGGFLRFEYSSGESVTVPMENYYSAFNAAYTANKPSEQSLSIKIDNIICTIKVSVKSQSNDLLSVKEQEMSFVSIVGTAIYLSKEYTLSDFENIFMSYLTISFYNNDNIVVNANSYPSLKMGNKITLKLTNGEQIVTTYSITLMGDTNSDGKLDKDDISGMIYYLMQERTNIFYLDANNDGKYTLTDFVIWMERLNK